MPYSPKLSTWGLVGQRLNWIKPFTRVRDVSFLPEDFRVRWYFDGVLNVSVNCLDRHLAVRGEQTAIIYEGYSPNVSGNITHRALYKRVCRLAKALSEALIGHIVDCQRTLVITADADLRCAKVVPLKANVDVALENPLTGCVEQLSKRL